MGQAIFHFNVYTLRDLNDLSNLIGSLSRTIQQYSPPSEWIMCGPSVFPIVLEKDLLKVDKILGLTFLRQEKTWKDSKRRFFHLLLRSFVLGGFFPTPVYSRIRGRFVNSRKENLAQKSKFIYDKQI